MLRGSAEGEKVRKSIADEAVGVSALSVHEVLYGARGQETAQFEDFMKAVHVLSFDADVARKSASLELSLKRKGKNMGKIDTFIAATCMTHQLPLLTLDKGFKNVEGLRVLLA